jgi:poly-gamma-glutamate synthesis protein (capsule biosynthesis protein)
MTRRRFAAALAASLLGLVACGGGGDDAAPSGDTGTPGAPPSTAGTTVTPTTVRDQQRGSGQPVTIAFAGDMHFEGVVANRLAADPASVVGPFTEVLTKADLAVGNLESAVTEGGKPENKDFTFRVGPAVVDAMRAAGFDAVSMANNHGRDFGAAGLADSLAVRAAQPDGFIIGIGQDEADALKPFRAEVKGQRIAVIAATQILDSSLISAWTATPDQPGLASAKRVDSLVGAVRAARADSDTVVVFLHWGTEKDTCPNDAQQELATALAEAGADVVVGGHAHRVQGGGFHPAGPFVAYGLGNFVFRAQGTDSAKTGVLQLTVTGRQVDGFEWLPGTIVDSQPRPLDGPAAAKAVADWDALRGCAGLQAAPA